jgi:hypothetical protein
MNIGEKLIMRYWPRNTLRVAYLRWQTQEEQLVEARQRLARQYLISRRLAERMQFSAHLGVLRTARSLLDQPLDSPVLMVKERLEKGFVYLGAAYFRKIPSPLDAELEYYIARIVAVSRRLGELEVRLRLTQEIFRIFEQTPEFCHRQFFRLAFTSPEAAWLLIQIRTKRHQNRQAIQDCLAETCQFQIQ